MNRISNTQFFQVENGPQIQAKDLLEIVYQALREKGYNPVSQMVGYIMCGDPTYITSHNNARSIIMKVERDELIEESLTYYINNNKLCCDFGLPEVSEEDFRNINENAYIFYTTETIEDILKSYTTYEDIDLDKEQAAVLKKVKNNKHV